MNTPMNEQKTDKDMKYCECEGEYVQNHLCDQGTPPCRYSANLSNDNSHTPMNEEVKPEKPELDQRWFTIEQMERCWDAAKDIDRSKYLDFMTWLKCQIFPIPSICSRIKGLEQEITVRNQLCRDYKETVELLQSRIAELEAKSSPLEKSEQNG